MRGLFGTNEGNPPKEAMAEGAVLLRSTALPFEEMVLAALSEITTVSPFRHMVTPGGFTMSVAMTNCGTAGWVAENGDSGLDEVDIKVGTSYCNVFLRHDDAVAEAILQSFSISTSTTNTQ